MILIVLGIAIIFVVTILAAAVSITRNGTTPKMNQSGESK